ncbi:MAG: Mur ligase family protein, partial [Oscillospiraceae bacterium]
GTPQTLLRLEPCHQAAVIEMGMDHFGQIRYMGSLVQPTIAVITNVGHAHIENLGGTRQGTSRAKCEISTTCAPAAWQRRAATHGLADRLHFPDSRCGRSEHCTIRVTDIVRRGIYGLHCTVTTPRRSYRLSIPSPGDGTRHLASMAVAIGGYPGLSEQEIAQAWPGMRTHWLPAAAHRSPEDGLSSTTATTPTSRPWKRRWRFWRTSRLPPPVAALGDMGAGPHQPGTPTCSRWAAPPPGWTWNAAIAIGPKAAAIAETAGPQAQHFAAIEEALPAADLQKPTAPLCWRLVCSTPWNLAKLSVNWKKMQRIDQYDRYQRNRPGQVLYLKKILDGVLFRDRHR